MLNEAPTMHPFLIGLLPACCCWKTPLVSFSQSPFQIGCIHQFSGTSKDFGGLSAVKVGASTVFLALQCCDLYSSPAVSLLSKPAHTSVGFLNHTLFLCCI